MSEAQNSGWTRAAASILDPEKLEAVRKHLDTVGNIVVEHWHYCGARGPTPLAFNDFEVFEAYLKQEVRQGDAIDVYPFPHQSKVIASGKYPDSEGRVPVRGAY